jgi:Mrp family chromosome partitioning ATPase
LLLALAVIFAIVAALAPVGSAKHTAPKFRWANLAVVGAEPPVGASSAGINSASILFWANNYYTKVDAADYIGLNSQAAKLAPLMSGVATDYNVEDTSKQTATTVAPKSTKKSSQTNVVALNVVGETAKLTVLLANAYAEVVGNSVNRYFDQHQAAAATTTKTQSSGSTLQSGYEILAPALLQSAAKVKGTTTGLSASKKVRGLIGLVIGLLLGAAIVLVREAMDKTLRSATRAEATFRYPVLGEIPERPKSEGGPSTTLDVVGDPNSSPAEAYRMLRMSIMFERLSPGLAPLDMYGDGSGGFPATSGEPFEAPEPGSRQVILVVSAGNEETRSVVAANLGATYGEAGQRVIVTSTGDIDSGYAAGNVKVGTGGLELFELSAHLQSSSLANVSRLSLRPFVGTSGQLVTRAAEVLDAARQLADVIIVEAPPLLISHHGEALVHAVDAVLIVGECGTTTMDEARRTGDILRRVGAPVLGVVLTKVQLSTKDVRLTTFGSAPNGTAPNGSAPNGTAPTGRHSAPVSSQPSDTAPQLVPDPTQV